MSSTSITPLCEWGLASAPGPQRPAGWRLDGGWMEAGWRLDGGWMEAGWRVAFELVTFEPCVSKRNCDRRVLQPLVLRLEFGPFFSQINV